MKLLFISRRACNRGGQVILTNLIRHLTAQGLDIDFVIFKPRGQQDFPDCEALYQDMDVTTVEIPTVAHPQAQSWEYVNAATDYLKDHHAKYDRIVLDSWFILLAAVRAQIISPKVFQLVQSDPVFTPKNDDAIWEATLFGLLPQFPVQRIVESDAIQAVFRNRYGYTCDKINLFIDDVYHDATFEVVARTPLRFISSAADFSIPSKGLDFLLQSLAAFTGQPFELTLVAAKPITQNLDAYAFPITVKSASNPTEMKNILQTQDVYINTSTNETFCLALAEAVALGMPAIALDSVGNRDYALGDNFLFVRDQADFFAQLREICQIETRQQLANKAKASMAHYSIDTSVRQLRDILKV